MDKKAIIYFISVFLILSSAGVYFTLKELSLSEESYTMTGEYDIWVSETSGGADTATAETESLTTEYKLLIDINTASEKELTELKGIGKVTAANIVAYRQSNGGFSCIEEIKNVKGIGEKTFLEIKNHIYVKAIPDN